MVLVLATVALVVVSHAMSYVVTWIGRAYGGVAVLGFLAAAVAVVVAAGSAVHAMANAREQDVNRPER